MKLQLSFHTLAVLLVSTLGSSLAKPISTAEVKAKSALGFNLLTFAEGAEPVWKSAAETDALIAEGAKFIDVTEIYALGGADSVATSRVAAVAAAAYPSPSKQTAVKALLAQISLSTMQGYLNSLTAYNNRYHTSSTGQAASVWIKDTMAAVAAKYPTSGASVALYAHSWTQSSIIAKIPGTNSTGPITILGGHMDSINGSGGSSARAPGADDDGSGSANLMEAFRVLVTSGFKPTNPVEFHWYAGEEAGLKGSGAIATAYKNAKKPVRAMLQLDMTAYVKPGTSPVIGLMPDYTTAGLNTFTGALIDTYTSTPWVTTSKCGYACSDHASWYNAGYPTTLPFESTFANQNPNIHKTADTTSVSGFSWEHSLEYVRIAIGFAYELAA
ncbi:hypothetical protein D9619_006643 [Psilocybe cf. subviscida]|uniref:Peptide hydrolase n=1 Tax=Psilocybe cf. subviscida TaxID=2480587 RepID=A0A8H5B3R5_9AGAR|nr:hypothetical protein D9619_006643 [Psilocybe cf. subviscida]